MKLVRYGPRGREKPGLVDTNGYLRDLSAHVNGIGWDELSPSGQRRLLRIDPASLPRVRGRPRLGVPYSGISKIVAIGLNYRDHAAEANLPIPAEPIIFLKATTCINGPFDPLIKPPESTRMDWEAELGVVIGREARRVAMADAARYIAGYCAFNDVSERDFQMERGGTWDKGKGCDSFGPIGPWLVTADEIPDPQNLSITLDVNDVRMQTGNTRHMIFPCTFLLSYVSRFMTLMPGDIIATGTPPGVGMGRGVYLNVGDRIRLAIDGLGAQQQTVVSS